MLLGRLSCELQSAILHIASTQFYILTVLTFVDLKKKKHISEIKVYQQSHGNKKWTTKSRKSLERSTDEDSVLGTFFYSVAPFHTARTPPALRVLSGDDLAAHVRSVGAQHSSVAAG